MLQRAETVPFDFKSRQVNLEVLRSQLMRRFTLLLIGASSLAAWLTLPQNPFPTVLFGLFAFLLVMGLAIWGLVTTKPIFARHLLVWALTAGLLSAMWLFPDSWVPFLGLLLILAGAMLMSGSELVIAGVIALASVWLVYIGERDYPLTGLFATMTLSMIMVWLSVHSLYTALQWTETMRQRADRLLEEVRNHRAELSRTLKSSDLANTLLRRTERELIAARKQADQARRLKEQFAVNISHELRTPLNLILGFSEMMYLSPEVYGTLSWPPTLRRDVHQIYRSSRHLLEMIDDVLDLSRVEMASFTLNTEPTQLESLLHDTAAIAADLFRGHPVQLEVDLASGLPTLEIDRTRIRQVLLNLLNNARRFTADGTVKLTAKQVGNEVVNHHIPFILAKDRKEKTTMLRKFERRDYSIIGGLEEAIALDGDLIEDKVEGTWWEPDLPGKELKAMMKRTDGVALWHFGLWLVLLAVSGYLAYLS